MKTQFKGLLKRRDCGDDLVEIFMQQGIARSQRELRVPAMEKSIVFNVEEYAGLGIPTDFLELKEISANFRTLRRADMNKVLAGERYPGEPEWFARQGAKWRLAPYPETGTAVRIDYWAEAAALAADSDENIISKIAPDLIVYAALGYAASYYVDKRANDFQGAYQTIKDELQTQADVDELSGGASVTPAYSFPEDC
jgi:hypothetical protein